MKTRTLSVILGGASVIGLTVLAALRPPTGRGELSRATDLARPEAPRSARSVETPEAHLPTPRAPDAEPAKTETDFPLQETAYRRPGERVSFVEHMRQLRQAMPFPAEVIGRCGNPEVRHEAAVQAFELAKSRLIAATADGMTGVDRGEAFVRSLSAVGAMTDGDVIAEATRRGLLPTAEEFKYLLEAAAANASERRG